MSTVVWVGLIAVSYLCVAALVPIGQSTPIVDEPIYASSAFEFSRSGEIVISNLSAPNAVFDTVWGGLFARMFGETYGSLRLATVVLSAISAPFVYVLCREAGGSSRVSLLGTATYLYAPLALTLSFTFHTDPHALALVVIASAFVAQALRRRSWQLMLLASFVSSIGYLSRPQSLVVPGATLIAIWLSDWKSGKWQFAVLSVVLPLITFIGHALWVAVSGEPFIREISRASVLGRSVDDIGSLLSQTVILAPFYVGLFVLPMLPFLLPSRRNLSRYAAKPVAAVGVGLLVLGIALVLDQRGPFDRRTWLTDTGLGGVDRSHLGSRPDMLGTAVWPVITFLLLLACLVLFMNLKRSERRDARSLRVFLITSVFAFIAAAPLSSLALQGLVFDRYFLPVLPFAIALAASVAADTYRRLVYATVITVPIALFGIAGTYDAFVAYREVNQLANELVASGIPPLELDGGASWSASTFGLADETPQHLLHRKGPYWIKFFAVNSDPKLGIALAPLQGYEVMRKHAYPSLLHIEETFLYVLRPESGLQYFQRAEDF